MQQNDEIVSPCYSVNFVKPQLWPVQLRISTDYVTMFIGCTEAINYAISHLRIPMLLLNTIWIILLIHLDHVTTWQLPMDNGVARQCLSKWEIVESAGTFSLTEAEACALKCSLFSQRFLQPLLQPQEISSLYDFGAM